MSEIGAHRKRVEDPPLLRGQGQYVEDLRLPGTVDVAFVRSTHPHARITRVDLAEARAAPGVLAAWSGEQVRHVPRVPVRIRMPELHASPLPALAQDVVTMVGYPIAAVVATDRSLARDAAELVQVEYEPLDPIVDPEQALDSASPRLFPELGTNLGYRMRKEGGDVDAALARADRRVSLRVQHSRLAPVPMEPRGILASFDRADDRLTIWRSTQSPFGTRTMLAAVLERPEASIRVIAPDVGGAFGAKTALYPDELTTVLLALELGVPVRWVSTRIEDLQLTVQGRDIVNHVDAGIHERGHRHGAERPQRSQPRRRADASGRHTADARRGLRHRRVPHSRLPRRSPGRVHQHRPDRAVPRRWPARGGHGGGTHRRSRGARAWTRSDHRPPSKPSPAGRVPVHDAGRQRVRQRALRGRAGSDARGARPCRCPRAAASGT